jgi:hypothetical protein
MPYYVTHPLNPHQSLDSEGIDQDHALFSGKDGADSADTELRELFRRDHGLDADMASLERDFSDLFFHFGYY